MSEPTPDDLGGLRIDRDRVVSKKRPRGLWLVLALVVLVGLAMFWRLRAGLWPGSQVQVEVAMALEPTSSEGGQKPVLTANGYVKARRTAAVSSEVTGRLERLLVEEGSRVDSGDLLAELASEDLQARVARAEADLAVRKAALAEARAERTETENELERQQKLLERGLATESAFEIAQARRDVVLARINSAEEQQTAAGAALRLARAELAKTRIRAPFSGTILTKSAEIGEMVAPVSLGGSGSRGAIVTIADLESIDVEVDVNEAYIGRLVLGQSARVVTDAYPSTPYEARVRQIVPTSDRQKATVLVKTEILSPDSRLLPDMGAKVTFFASADPENPVPTQPAFVTVPDLAVQQEKGQSIVWILHDDQTVERRSVDLGSKSNGRIEVTSGLTGGERLALRPSRPLQTGMTVRTR